MLLLKKNPNLSDEFELFLKSIGHLLSMQLESTHHATGIKERVSSVKTQLTQRQEVICSFLEKGFTNPQIAEEIGYSESLIRQETIAIYSALQISGRKELIFKKL